MCVHKPHLKVTALVTEVYGYYNYVGCVVYYKYVLCLCCASGLVNLKTPYGPCRMVRHTSFVSPFVSCDTRHKRPSVTLYSICIFILNVSRILTLCRYIVINLIRHYLAKTMCLSLLELFQISFRHFVVL